MLICGIEVYAASLPRRRFLKQHAGRAAQAQRAQTHTGNPMHRTTNGGGGCVATRSVPWRGGRDDADANRLNLGDVRQRQPASIFASKLHNHMSSHLSSDDVPWLDYFFELWHGWSVHLSHCWKTIPTHIQEPRHINGLSMRGAVLVQTT